ncbi:MAG TPA: hypothetical protein DEB10_03015 [Ruminococcaceae bacterium]|jgi:LmbE family N-acetylglucosaminyl deacetylase|nr:hypothetical protein [Oscillospiraceae bacterium]
MTIFFKRVLFILFCFFIIVYSVQADKKDEYSEKKIRKTAASLSITIYNNQNTKKIKSLTDNNVSTVWKFSKGNVLHIKSTKSIGALYILWDIEPVEWTIIQPNKTATIQDVTSTTTNNTNNTTSTALENNTIASTSTTPSKNTATKTELSENTTASDEHSQNDTVYRGGTNGFLHELAVIDRPSGSLTMHFNKSKGSIADIFAFEADQIPDWVQQWQPMLDKADMLVYPAHADDELLWFGGTLPVYAGEYKKKVQVAYLIRHGKALNEFHRNHELLDGLWKTGVRNYPMISDFEDYYSSSLKHAKKIYNEEKMLEYSVMLLRRFKPEVVVGHDPNGEYGHGVHMLCSKSLQDAISISADPSKFPSLASKYGTWKIKKCYLHLYKKNRIEMDWNVPLKAFEGKTGLDIAKEAYKFHTSQNSKWFRVKGKGSKYDCQKFGLYHTIVGADIAKNDFFEHIDPVIPITTAAKTTITSQTTHKTTTTTAYVSTTTSQTKPTTEPIVTAVDKPVSMDNSMHHYVFIGFMSILISVFTAAIIFIIRYGVIQLTI